MQELPIFELMEKAREFQKSGKKWHFHILTPICRFNEIKNKHAFVLENESDRTAFVTYSEKRHFDQGKELVKLIYGESIFEAIPAVDPSAPSEKIKKMIENAKLFNKNGIPWEHHLFFPSCVFNKHVGKWVMVFESREEIIESITEEEPIEDLRKIEVLYYLQKK